MEIKQFLKHHGLSENPFNAEEARHDPVFDRLTESTVAHQDFDKILGDVERPSSAIVFGEKGSGKTAIRLTIGRRVSEFNEKHPEKRAFIIGYDDLNPWLDRIVQKRQGGMNFRKASKTAADKLLGKVRLQDHQDAILSLGTTKLLDGLLGQNGAGDERMPLPDDVDRRLRSMPRHLKVDLALLAALYDQPRSDTVLSRWGKLRNALRLRMLPPLPYLRYIASALTIVFLLCFIGLKLFSEPAGWVEILAWITGIGAVGGWCAWAYSRYVMLKLATHICREVLAVDRDARQVMNTLLDFKGSDLVGQPWPTPGVAGAHNSRFEFTHKLLRVLEQFGYHGIIVLIDRVDEPSLITGQAPRMKAVIWPLFDNKFLQQQRVGIKMLLPIELRYELNRESADFFQEARLDKQNMVDRLTWSGATLYDICTNRMRACLRPPAQDNGDSINREITLRDLFTEEVTRQMLVEALDQMHQPRDAFKFLYAVIQEHCRGVSQDEADYLVPRSTLEATRRLQSQRVQDLARGLAPA